MMAVTSFMPGSFRGLALGVCCRDGPATETLPGPVVRGLTVLVEVDTVDLGVALTRQPIVYLIARAMIVVTTPHHTIVNSTPRTW